MLDAFYNMPVKGFCENLKNSRLRAILLLFIDFDFTMPSGKRFLSYCYETF